MKVGKPLLTRPLKGEKKIKAKKLESISCTFKISFVKEVSLYFYLLSMQMNDGVCTLGRELVKMNEAPIEGQGKTRDEE